MAKAVIVNVEVQCVCPSKKWHIYAIILVIVIAQWLQLSFDVAKAVIVNAEVQCEKELSSLDDFQKCWENESRVRDLSFRLHRSLAGVIESVGFTCIIIA